MKIFRHILTIVCAVTLSLLPMSCGIVDIEIDEQETTLTYEMRLNHDTVYVMPCDTFALTPIFTPDSVSTHDVYFLSAAEDIAKVENNSIIAVGPGETRITAISVLSNVEAYCDVFVMNQWSLNTSEFSDDMVVYAKVTVDGQPFNPSMQRIAAFAGPEFRGEGHQIELAGETYIRFRIYSHMEWGNDEPTEPAMIRFGLYNRENLSFSYSEQFLTFDGETHGSPSSPMNISF